MEIRTKNHHKSQQPKTTVEIGRLHHLQTVGIGTAKWFVLRGVVVAGLAVGLSLVVAGLGGSRFEKRAVGLSLVVAGLTPWVSLLVVSGGGC